MRHEEEEEWEFKEEFPMVKQPWYANDTGARGHFTNLFLFFELLKEIGTAYSYFPEPSKTILVVRAHITWHQPYWISQI
jgi:predicted lipid-binding transport protein (Tim44 family)